jgi:putative transposase
VPRANRICIPRHAWHITHRCHEQSFLLKFARDRRRWRHWVFEAKRRYGLSVLDDIATSNHIHLRCADRGHDEIPTSMQLIAGRSAQDFNRRKDRRGAFWEDRYHAAAVQTDSHLARCITYIDLNMVRAGAVAQLARIQDQWLDAEIETSRRAPDWTESAAIGDEEFVTDFKAMLEPRGFHREISSGAGGWVLRDTTPDNSASLPSK